MSFLYTELSVLGKLARLSRMSEGGLPMEGWMKEWEVKILVWDIGIKRKEKNVLWAECGEEDCKLRELGCGNYKVCGKDQETAPEWGVVRSGADAKNSTIEYSAPRAYLSADDYIVTNFRDDSQELLNIWAL